MNKTYDYSKYNDELIYDIIKYLNELGDKYNCNVAIVGSLSLFLLYGFRYDRPIHDIDIYLFRFNNGKIDRISDQQIIRKNEDFLRKKGINISLDILTSRFKTTNEYIKYIKYKNYNIYCGTLDLCIHAKKVRMHDYLWNINYKNTCTEILNKIQYKIDNNIFNERNDKYDDLLYTMISYLYTKFPDKDIVICGSHGFYLHGIDFINKSYNHNLDIFIINESDSNNSYKEYKKLFINDLHINHELYFRTKPIKNVDNCYDVIKLKDIDVKVSTLSNLINAYQYKIDNISTYDSYTKHAKDFEIIKKFIEENDIHINESFEVKL